MAARSVGKATTSKMALAWIFIATLTLSIMPIFAKTVWLATALTIMGFAIQTTLVSAHQASTLTLH